MQLFQWTTIKDLEEDIPALEISHNEVSGYIISKRIFRYLNGINISGQEDESYKVSVYLRISGMSDTLLGETLFIGKNINPVDVVKSHLFEIMRLVEEVIENKQFRSIDLSADVD